jgi:hypothetical protein
MKINKVKKIIIFGGGTSGWLTAAYITNNLQFPCEITLIESKDLGPIGVGEGTQPATARFMFDCGIDPKTWMKPSNATFKLGVEFEGWNDEPYFVENDFIENTIIAPNLFTTDYFVGKDKKEFFNWLPAYQLAKANKSPKLAGMDTNYAQTGYRQFGAVHFGAYDILETIKSIVLKRINYVNTMIKDVETNEEGVTALIDEDGNKYSADLYLDCTGFASILLEKKLGVEFTSVNDILPCDSAVVIPTQYTNPEEECFPYTKATAMDAGWMFTIPTFQRVGNGYVYSSKFKSSEDAEKELREKIGEFTAPAKHLKMKCGIHNSVAYKNVCAIGLAAGFVEPLEATGITFTTKAVELVTAGLNKTQGIWSQPLKGEINSLYDIMFWEIVAFVWAHYHFSTKNDTLFWNSIRQQTDDMMPQKVLDFVGKFVPKPNREFFVHPTSSFHVGHWFSVLNAGGVYDNNPRQVAGDVEKYAEYFVKNQTHRVELIKEIFPNHYEFLKDWYSSE